ncbi:MAG: SPW repeat domain-containing protein [Actinomycetes bacterium]
MLHQGPVPAVVHGVLEYAVAILFIVAPFVLGFEATSATAASLVVGLALLTFTAMSALPSGLVPSISLGVHVTVDAVFAVLLVALPFMLGFAEEGAPTALFITLGVLHLLVTIGTRFPERATDKGNEGRESAV